MRYKVYVDSRRIRVIAEKIRQVGLEPILLIEEHDPQFKAVLEIVERTNDECIAFLLIVLNAIVSYRLSSPGEEYWLEFASYVSSRKIHNVHEVFENIKRFLTVSKGNRLLREQKIRRLTKLLTSSSLGYLLDLCRNNRINLVEVADILANSLNSKRNSKTIVFACKMSYYFLKAIGHNIIPPFEIDIPVDRRIALISYTSGLVKLTPSTSNVRKIAPILLHNSSLIASTWREISNLSSIPPLNIDSLAWLISKGIGVKPVSYVREQALRRLSRIIDYALAKNLVEELFCNDYTV